MYAESQFEKYEKFPYKMTDKESLSSEYNVTDVGI
jgi:hypothetical protein